MWGVWMKLKEVCSAALECFHLKMRDSLCFLSLDEPEKYNAKKLENNLSCRNTIT